MIPLEYADLCLDDSMLFDRRAGPVCPSCGSLTAWPVSRFLDRRPLVITPREVVALTEPETAPADAMEQLRRETLAQLEGALAVARQHAKRDANA